VDSSGYGKQITYEKRTDGVYWAWVYRCSPPSEKLDEFQIDVYGEYMA
jgi:hypothetical protein